MRPERRFKPGMDGGLTGRRLTQPATPSKDWRNFVQTMGSTSNNPFRSSRSPSCSSHVLIDSAHSQERLTTPLPRQSLPPRLWSSRLCSQLSVLPCNCKPSRKPQQFPSSWFCVRDGCAAHFRRRSKLENLRRRRFSLRSCSRKISRSAPLS
jgi:hypothetical protein